ncbi:MAG TPA: phosphoribosylformylglycinamidine synthase subunit PurQ [Spirochaetota bacterium]|nr:phosphoribosylformylglycinamidine synthase subunit PurQ [Spirochaetota bacterium]HPI88297.1 phosphoribosylformylglycinamidine synthase subunit PurQ [Spirochaetota bacterium]HPR47761.1 phosphoribosylformylglycinamidine synthase subunit PurQ [Spirochaetota bacterium]
MKPRALVLTGYGINCDEETRFALDFAGADASIIHVNDLIENKNLLKQCHLFIFPGGFSYGDDTGSGKALANRIKNNLMDDFLSYINRDTLMLGICNGFQVMVNIGLVPGIDGYGGDAQVALEYNKTFRYQCRWVDLIVNKESPSVFTRGIDYLHIPVAHGEGNFYAPSGVLEEIEKKSLVTMRYAGPDRKPARGEFPGNPNGSVNDIASICDPTGRIMGMMPHPERGMFFTQRDDWTLLREQYNREGKPLPAESDGMKIFRNAVSYFAR